MKKLNYNWLIVVVSKLNLQNELLSSQTTEFLLWFKLCPCSFDTTMNQIQSNFNNLIYLVPLNTILLLYGRRYEVKENK